MNAATPPRTRSRLVAIATAAMLVLGLLPAVASANHNPNHGDPCRQAVPATIFADYHRARKVHRASIDCAFYRAITAGAGTNANGDLVYRPRTSVTRAQMAQFIVNTLISAGYDTRLPSGGGGDQFNDIGGNFARVAINRLARAGIVTGTGNEKYSPGASISRQQMASFIVQAANWAVDPDVASDGTERFDDVPATNVHKHNIEAGADAGLFQGTSATTFAPGRLVVRDQMATFLVSLLRHAFDEARAPTPYTATAGVDDTNIEAGGFITGQVTGSNIRHVAISGCGITSQLLVDRDEVTSGIQYRVRVPRDQPAGPCTLTFTVTFNNSRERSSTIQMTVRSSSSAP
jgi:hypothetical protein